jgi:hypothetical protein
LYDWSSEMYKSCRERPSFVSSSTARGILVGLGSYHLYLALSQVIH